MDFIGTLYGRLINSTVETTYTPVMSRQSAITPISDNLKDCSMNIARIRVY